MGKDRISSQEIADYTNINATQIRRDLSNFGKFGKRGVGYSIDGPARRDPQDPAHPGPAQHRAVGAGRLGQAIASSPIFAEHGISIAAVFDTDVRKLGTPVSGVEVTDYRRLKDVIREKNIVVGVLAVPAPAAQQAADDLVEAGVRIIFNYSEALLDVPGDVTVHTSNPGRRAPARALFPSDLAARRDPSCWHGYLLGGTGSNVYTQALAREWSRAGHDVTVVCQERHPELYDLGGARRAPGAARRAAAGLRPRPLRRARGAAAPGLHGGGMRELRRGERGCAARARPGRPRLREPRAARRAGRCGDRDALPRQGARLRARVLDARPSCTRGLGTRDARAGRGHLRRLAAHPRGARGRRRPRRPRARGAAGRRRRRVRAAGPRRRARRSARGGTARPAEPGQRERAAARTRATPSGSPSSSPATSPPSSTSAS